LKFSLLRMMTINKVYYWFQTNFVGLIEIEILREVF